MGNAKDPYLKSDGAWDQFIGHAISGLPDVSHEFAASPQYFEGGAKLEAKVVKLVDDVSTAQIPAQFRPVILFCLVASYYHHI